MTTMTFDSWGTRTRTGAGTGREGREGCAKGTKENQKIEIEIKTIIKIISKEVFAKFNSADFKFLFWFSFFSFSPLLAFASFAQP